MTGNVDLMIELEKLGLDIHAENFSGQNALNAAIVSMQHGKMFRYLLDKEVRFKNFSNGQSLLNKAIEKAERNSEAVYYAYYLIVSGAEVTSADHTLIKKLSQSNQKAYSLLIEKLPDLE